MRYLLVAMCLALTACATTPPPRYVSEEPSKVVLKDEPVYPVDLLPRGTEGSEMMQALTASLKAAREYIKEIREAVQPVEKK